MVNATETADAPLAIQSAAREFRLKRGGEFLQWGAAINGVLALLVAGVILVGAAFSGGLLDAGAAALLAWHDSATAVVLLGGLLLLLANGCALMLAFIGISAQEFWGLLFVWGIVAANLALLVIWGFLPGLVAVVTAGIAGVVITRDMGSFRVNPVLLKEIRERMRGARAFVVITVYLGLMSGFAVLMYLLQRGFIQSSITSTTGELGRSIFEGIFAVELLLIVFITPAFTSGAISNERERKTFDLLHITLLSKPAFIVGKLESALSYVFLLLLAAVPLQSIAFMFGGVGESELALAFVILATTAVTLGAVGIYFSTTSERTLSASVRAYVTMAAITVGIPVVMMMFVTRFNNAVGNTASSLSYAPGIEAAFLYIGALVVSLNPILAGSASQQLLVNQQKTVFWTATLSNGDKIPMVSPWITLVIIYLVVSVVMVILAVRRMHKADE